MKKLLTILLMYFFVLNLNAQGEEEEQAGLYFVYPTEGSTYYSGNWGSGKCRIQWYMVIGSGFWLLNNDWGTTLQYPDFSYSQRNQGGTGAWDVTKAGSYKIIGDAYLGSLTGSSRQYRTINFTVVDNEAPGVPANLAVSVYNTQDNAYPKINWQLRTELDVIENNTDAYLIERKLNNGSFVQITTKNGSTSEFIDFGVPYAGDGPNTAIYRIRAKDINGNISSYSTEVTIEYGWAWKIKGENQTKMDFNLYQNHPNPFNPSTVISFQIPISSYVILKIYDLLGNEINTIVEDFKEAGSYEVTFDATLLPSGLYLYSIQAGDFVSVKKMILSK